MRIFIHLAVCMAIALLAQPSSPVAALLPTVGGDAQAQNPPRVRPEPPGGCSDTFLGFWTDRNGKACEPLKRNIDNTYNVCMTRAGENAEQSSPAEELTKCFGII